MKKLLIASAIVVFVLLWLYTRSNTLAPIIQGGFTDADIRSCENAIREKYLEQLRNSSEVEKQQVASGSTTVEAHMIKVGDRKLEGFVKLTLRDEESKKLGLTEVTQTCEATMEMNSSQYIWGCKPDR